MVYVGKLTFILIIQIKNLLNSYKKKLKQVKILNEMITDE